MILSAVREHLDQFGVTVLHEQLTQSGHVFEFAYSRGYDVAARIRELAPELAPHLHGDDFTLTVIVPQQPRCSA
jgi:hypothetical protein